MAAALVQPETLARLHHLEVAARAVVEGLRAGAHRSPYKGHSVDFADHRPYVPGDDIRHLDWKVLARRDRLVLKRYEAEIDLTCTLAVDGSGSMGYQGERAALSKYRYASVLAATMAYLVLNQQDRVGLTIFSDHGVADEPPAVQGQLQRICHKLEAHGPAAATDSGTALARLAQGNVRKGLVVIFTDAMEDVEATTSCIERLRHRGHDVALIWVLDPDELDLGVGAVSRFQGLEADGELIAEPRALRQAYQRVVQEHRHALETACLARRVAFIPCTTADAPHLPMNQLLVALQRH